MKMKRLPAPHRPSCLHLLGGPSEECARCVYFTANCKNSTPCQQQRRPLRRRRSYMFSSVFRRALAAPVARAVARSPLAFAAVGTVSSLAAYAAAPMQCEPAPATALAGEPGTKRERTLILVKPDGVERGVVGAVISKFESKGYK